MSYSISFYLLLGFLGSFIGTIPFGPINLSVVNATLKDGIRGAMLFSIPAALIEFLYSYISLTCYWILEEAIKGNRSLPWLIAFIFFLGGLFFFFKKDKGNKEVKEEKGSNNFLTGFVVSALNPQAIPYWIFVIGFYQMQHYIDMSSTENLQLILVFVTGAAIGKIICLYLFAFFSKRIAHRLSRINALMNKIIGGVLFLIGLIQIIKVF